LRRDGPVFALHFVGRCGVERDQMRREAEHLHLFHRLTTGAEVAEIVEKPPLLASTPEYQMAQCGEMRLANAGGDSHGEDYEKEPAGQSCKQHRKRDEAEQILADVQERHKQSYTFARLPSGSFQHVEKLRILECRELERLRVVHQADAEPVAEPIAEHGGRDRAPTPEQVRNDGDRELEANKGPDV